MTLTDLESTVAVLGSTGEITDRNLFVLSVNRALRRFYSDRCISKEVRLALREIKPVLYRKKIECIKGDYIELPIDGVAFSMRLHGNGRYRLTDGDTSTVYAVDSMHEARSVRGFLTYGGKIAFWGSLSFTIYDFAVFDEMHSPHVYDIPQCGMPRVIDLREIYGDFMSFLSPVTDANGNEIENCRMKEGKVFLDPSFYGELSLSYRRLPTSVIMTEEEQTIDIPDEYLHLFTLLVAANYYYYADDSLSSYFQSLYNEGLENIKKYEYDRIDAVYTDTNGWA